MEVLPFLLLHLLNTLPVVLPVLAFLGLVVLAIILIARKKLSVLWGIVVFLIISFVFSLPLIKVKEGYNSFIAACNSNPPLSELTPVATVDGFYLLPYVYETGMRVSSITKAPYLLVDDGIYKYIESGKAPLYYRYSNSDKSHRPRKIGERTSRYNFEVTGPKQDVSVNNSYRKFSEIRIIDSNTGKVVAKATEHIFGGGIAGTYMRYFGHGNWSPDDIYLACGYAQNTPHSYRPNGGEREKVKIRQLYINADREFITRTLTPKSDKNRVEP